MLAYKRKSKTQKRRKTEIELDKEVGQEADIAEQKGKRQTPPPFVLLTG